MNNHVLLFYANSKKMELTVDQQIAYTCIQNAFRDARPVLLTGSAGTGKTTLTQFIARHCMSQNMGVCGIAPTHKASHVLSRTLNAGTIIPIPVFTVASMLGKVKQHSFIGSKTYGNKNTNKLNNYRIFILDEVSMTADDDVRAIVAYVTMHKKRILCIGDECQLPCPSAGFETTTILGRDVLQKRNSYVFQCPDFVKAQLTCIVRQAADSPIIRMATYIRDHMYDSVSATTMTQYTAFPTECILSYTEIATKFAEKAEQYSRDSVKIIAYTNASMTNHNKDVRRILNIDDCAFVHGEILMGYTNIGFPELVIENGQDYIVTRVSETQSCTISSYTNLCGYQNDLQLIGGSIMSHIHHNLFFIHVNHPANVEFMRELIRRARKVNSPRSTSKDYVQYMALKTTALFMESVYSFQNNIYTEESFKETHPLLFTNITELIHVETRTIIPSLKSKKIEQMYANIITERLQDTKMLGDSEQLADQFMVIEKDIYYGYAITSHKSQGSGYECVIADENDFCKIADKWNFRRNQMESRVREKNQLRYVAYTRAKKELFIAENVRPPTEVAVSSTEGVIT